jgi:hypothetical protein
VVQLLLFQQFIVNRFLAGGLRAMEDQSRIMLSEADLGRASLELALLYLTRAGQTPSAVPASLLDQVAEWVSAMWDH